MMEVIIRNRKQIAYERMIHTSWLFMSRIVKVILLFSCFSLFACGNKHPHTNNKNLNYEKRIDFHSNETALLKKSGNHNYQFLNCSSFGNDTYLYFYSREENTIDLYHVEKGLDTSIFLGNIGFTTEKLKATFTTKTSGYLLSKDNILYSLNGAIVDSIDNLNVVLNQDKYAVENGRLGFNFRIVSDSLLYLPVHIDPYSKGPVRMFDYPMTAIYNLNTGIIRTTGIRYPKHYHKNDYGLLRPITQFYHASSIIYNPNAQDEIWTYNLKNDSIQKHVARSIYQTREIQPLSFKSTPKTKDLLMRHSDLSGEYSHFVHDPYRRVYYRFFKHFREEKREDGFFTTYQDDVYSLMVLDEDFVLLGEYELPDPCFFIYFAYATPKGLIINNGSLFGEQNNKINVRTITFDMLN